MVEGFKIVMPHTELAIHLMERASYHDGRAKQKEEELPAIRKIVEDLKVNPNSAVGLSFKSAYNAQPQNLVAEMEQDIHDHRNKALLFRFYSEHLIADQYCLLENDLVRLEMVKR